VSCEELAAGKCSRISTFTADAALSMSSCPSATQVMLISKEDFYINAHMITSLIIEECHDMV